MALVGQAVSEKKIFEIVGRRTDGRRTPDHGHPISSPCEPNGSGELKKPRDITINSQTYFVSSTVTKASGTYIFYFGLSCQTTLNENFVSQLSYFQKE